MIALCSEGNYASFPRGFQRFLDYTKEGPKPYSLRYVGSMVADMHRTLLCAGEAQGGRHRRPFTAALRPLVRRWLLLLRPDPCRPWRQAAPPL